MNKRMKIITMMVVSMFLFGCETFSSLGKENKENANITLDTKGRLTNIQTKLGGEYITNVLSVQATEVSRTKCFEANAAIPTDAIAQVAREVRLAAGKGIDCGASGNDVLIAEADSKVKIKQANNSLIGTLAKSFVGGVVGYKSVDALANLGTALINRKTGDNVVLQGGGDYTNSSSKNEVTVDRKSTYQGAQGQEASYTQTTQEGLIVDPITVNPVELTDGAEDEETTEEPEAELTLGQQCTACGGDFVEAEQRCSNGEGGTFELPSCALVE